MIEWLCKWLPSDSSDLAAWAQAIGAIVAIYAAFRIARDQYKLAEQRWHWEEAQRHLEAIGVTKRLVEGMQAAIVRWELAQRDSDHLRIDASRATMQDLLALGQSVNFPCLGPEGFAAYLRLRAQCLDILATTSGVVSGQQRLWAIGKSYEKEANETVGAFGLAIAPIFDRLINARRLRS